ncbi:MAG: acetolactate synthase small subunit [Deltaproteobacteria bacterium]|nr:acetolactate synthase small subunit [Deltaproteobacteria bacterium]MCB9490270.1 acetolactate synthase small subunit [Deltaproteobacteria bacterium]
MTLHYWGTEKKQLVLSATVENIPGVLTRISGLFARRGFNIESLSVGHTEDPNISRLTVVVNEADHPIEQVEKQLHKLVNVLKINRMEPHTSVARALMLIKVHAPPAKRVEIFDLVNAFRGKVVDVSRSSIVAEINGSSSKLDAFADLMKPYGVIEVVRSGKIAMTRGK